MLFLLPQPPVYGLRRCGIQVDELDSELKAVHTAANAGENLSYRRYLVGAAISKRVQGDDAFLLYTDRSGHVDP